MALIARWFRGMRKAEGDAPPPPDAAVNKAIALDASVVSAQDTDTARQWNFLRTRIAQTAEQKASAKPEELRVWFRPAFAVVFGVVAIAMVVGYSLLKPVTPLLYQTGVAQTSSVRLADSSEVILNHNSELSVEMKGKGATGSRQTTLTGEAFFKVHRNGSPFVVATDIGSVTVLGTEFNVRVRRGEMEVAVVTGKVSVMASRDGRDSTVVLRVGEFTVLTKGGYPASPQRLPFAENYPGWIHGKFLLNRQTLASACNEIAEQFGTRVEIANAAIAGETITGAIDGRNIESAVKTLSLLSGASYRYENNAYILY
jgi:transmembrane sensor